MISLDVEIRSKTYGNGLLAIKQLAFRAEPGEFVAIVGPSGAGKTTLLNLVAGLDVDFDGSIAFNGRKDDAGKRYRTGFMFQEPRLMPWLTVVQNIRLVLKPYADVMPQQEARLAQLLELVGLGGFGAMYPAQLSTGMRRRAALVRAFIIEPDLLLMDEPFESLDAPTAAQLRQLLLELWRRTSPTVLFVTHNLQEALSLADRILFLSPRPSRMILDYPVPLSGPREMDSEPLHRLRQQLLSDHPQLLEGTADAPMRRHAVGDCRGG